MRQYTSKEMHAYTKPAFNVGPSSARQRLRADDGPFIVVFGLWQNSLDPRMRDGVISNFPWMDQYSLQLHQQYAIY